MLVSEKEEGRGKMNDYEDGKEWRGSKEERKAGGK